MGTPQDAEPRLRRLGRAEAGGPPPEGDARAAPRTGQAAPGAAGAAGPAVLTSSPLRTSSTPPGSCRAAALGARQQMKRPSARARSRQPRPPCLRPQAAQAPHPPDKRPQRAAGQQLQALDTPPLVVPDAPGVGVRLCPLLRPPQRSVVRAGPCSPCVCRRTCGGCSSSSLLSLPVCVLGRQAGCVPACRRAAKPEARALSAGLA